MTIRRAIVWGISILFGAASAVGVIFVFNTTLAKFSLTGLLLIFLSLGSFAFIWLDYIFQTEYLRT
jgi:hypothetical protein